MLCSIGLGELCWRYSDLDLSTLLSLVASISGRGYGSDGGCAADTVRVRRRWVKIATKHLATVEIHPPVKQGPVVSSTGATVPEGCTDRWNMDRYESPLTIRQLRWLPVLARSVSYKHMKIGDGCTLGELSRATQGIKVYSTKAQKRRGAPTPNKMGPAAAKTPASPEMGTCVPLSSSITL